VTHARREHSGAIARAFAWLALGTLCIAFSAIFVKKAAVPGATSAFYRVAIAFVAAWGLRFSVARSRKERLFPVSRREALVSLAGGAALGVDLVLWQASLLLTTAASATVLANLAPVWVGIMAVVFLKEHQRAPFWLGAIVALVGTMIVGTRGHWALSSVSLGDGLAIVASVFYAIYQVVTRRQRQTLDNETFLVLSMAGSLLICALGCVITRAPMSGFTTVQWANLVAVGLISHFVGYYAINHSLGHLRATVVTVVLLGQPVATAILAIPLLREALTPALIVGGLTVVGGLAVALGVQDGRRRVTRPSPSETPAR